MGDIDSIKDFCNVMALFSFFFRVFANETSQFLAPYEASVKSRSGSDSPPENAIGNSSRAVNIPDSHRHLVGVSASHVSTWWHVDYITGVCNLSSLTQYTKIKFPLMWFGCYNEMYGGCFTHCVPDFHIPCFFQSMEWSAVWEADSCSAGQGIPCRFCTLFKRVQCRSIFLI